MSWLKENVPPYRDLRPQRSAPSVGGPQTQIGPVWGPSVKRIDLDLSIARTNVIIPISGRALAFVESYNTGQPSPNDLIQVIFDSASQNDPVPFRPFSEVFQFPFSQLIISNLAIPGSTDAVLLVFNGGAAT